MQTQLHWWRQIEHSAHIDYIDYRQYITLCRRFQRWWRHVRILLFDVFQMWCQRGIECYGSVSVRLPNALLVCNIRCKSTACLFTISTFILNIEISMTHHVQYGFFLSHLSDPTGRALTASRPGTRGLQWDNITALECQWESKSIF